MPYLPDDDEGDVRVGLLDAVLAIAVALFAVPGVFWLAGVLISVGRSVLEAFR